MSLDPKLAWFCFPFMVYYTVLLLAPRAGQLTNHLLSENFTSNQSCKAKWLWNLHPVTKVATEFPEIPSPFQE